MQAFGKNCIIEALNILVRQAVLEKQEIEQHLKELEDKVLSYPRNEAMDCSTLCKSHIPQSSTGANFDIFRSVSP